MPQQGPLAETEYLPEEGFFLEAPTPVSESDIKQAVERGNVAVFTGQVELANRSKGEWSLLTDTGMKTGRTAPGGPSLDGLQVGKRYRFNCAEITEPDPLWRNRKTLYLRKIETA